MRTRWQRGTDDREKTPLTSEGILIYSVIEDIRHIQELLGHSNIKTTQIYTHVAKQQTEKIISPLDQIMKRRLKVGELQFRSKGRISETLSADPVVI